MKTKAKLTLAISIMSAAVLAAGVTSTFAWFSTRSTVNFNSGNLTVSTLSKLTITGSKVVGGDLAAGGTASSITATDSDLGAVSSTTGANFFAPTTLGDNAAGAGKYTAIDSQAAVDTLKTTNKYAGYLKYNLLIKSEKTDDKEKDLKLKITVTPTGDNIVNWYRVAVYKITSDSETVLTGNQSIGTAIGVYSNAAATDTAVTSTAGATSSTARTVLPTGDITITEKFTSDEDDTYQHVCVAVWMEGGAPLGTGIDDQNIAGGQKVKVDFTFSV